VIPADQAGHERDRRRRQRGQRVLDRGSQRLRHDRGDQALTQVQMICQHPRQDRHPEQQQREDAQESVVGDKRRLPPARIVAVLLHHRVGEPQHALEVAYQAGRAW
jgi:ABC-type dipeptide/oligopeptide/nickel transport system ATPase subunit